MDLIDFSQVVAHPDDEAWWGAMFFRTPLFLAQKSAHKNRGVPKAMFFWPTLSQLRAAGVTISVLCLSTGNFDGLGDIRKREPRHKQVFCVRGLVKFRGESWAFSCLFISSANGQTPTKNECKEMEKSCMQIGFLACKEKTFDFCYFSGFILFCKKRGVTGDDLQILDDSKLQDRWVQLPSSWLPDSPIFFTWGWLAKMAIQPCGSQGGFFVGRMGVKGLYLRQNPLLKALRFLVESKASALLTFDERGVSGTRCTLWDTWDHSHETPGPQFTARPPESHLCFWRRVWFKRSRKHGLIPWFLQESWKHGSSLKNKVIYHLSNFSCCRVLLGCFDCFFFLGGAFPKKRQLCYFYCHHEQKLQPFFFSCQKRFLFIASIWALLARSFHLEIVMLKPGSILNFPCHGMM